MCKINTGLTTFDSQTKYLGIGNVISDTQYSTYINKDTFEDDIKKFDLIIDQRVLVKQFLEENSICVLYKFFFKKRGFEETIGFILTNKEKTNIKMFGARTKKRIDALGNIINIIVSK